MERDFGQPEGRKRIAQRFIAGSGQPGAVESRRDDRNHGLRLSPAGVLSSPRDFRAAGSEPSDKSLGYFRSSLRDSRSEARRLRPPWARRAGSIPPKTARNRRGLSMDLHAKCFERSARRKRWSYRYQESPVVAVRSWRRSKAPLHEPLEAPPGFGVRQSSGALAMEASRPKAPEDWRSPRRYRAIRRFLGPMHAEKRKEALHELGGKRNDSRRLGWRFLTLNLNPTLNRRAESKSKRESWEEPWQDPQVWEMIASGGARAVHHIESPAMTSLCRMCNVREIDGLIAIVSVIRPGAANEGKKLAFTRRYQGMEPVACPHPTLESCLWSTYGLVVYEEHILQLSEAFAGLSPGRADVLRRALNKQKRGIIEEIHGEFFASAHARGHSPEKIAEVWELVTGFAGYAFCKAHSTAYGVEAYQAAWLKRYFPAEFMSAVLTNGKGFYHPLVYVLECHRLGLKLLPPSVNQPGPAGVWSVERGAWSVERSDAPTRLRVPVLKVKGLTNR